ncbi:unnamed protein product [Nesidiocoris tenuis]|uniref:TRPM tetramerisation domain-containing protein n=1 Tax=Nesidiocoris tenuis TaxID=355587 RepID=A0A6H5HPD9_9HEMI|nr:unnamed protein product [Nesidiocoris tenuis]
MSLSYRFIESLTLCLSMSLSFCFIARLTSRLIVRLSSCFILSVTSSLTMSLSFCFIVRLALRLIVWMFQRFTVVMEYEQKPVLPPPLIFICHIYLLLKFLRRKVRGDKETYDNGLKLFLDSEDLERLYDFEEECVEGYFREKENKLHQSTEERIKQTTDRVENISQKIEDIIQKENNQNSSLQVSMDFAHLDRPRRRPPIRALTEVRPDYVLHETVHFQAHPRVNPPLLRTDTLRTPYNEADEDQLESKQPENVSARKSYSPISEESTEETGEEEGGESRRSSLLFTVNRQLSQTHSEPEAADSSSRQHLPMVERSVTWAEPRIQVIPPTSHPRSLLMAMHSEYTSITDELENVCGLLSPPKSPSLLTPLRHNEGPPVGSRRSRHHSEMSNPEMARFLEKEHLRDAEESDYLLMEGLIQRRLKASDDDKFQNNAFFLATTPEMERFQVIGNPVNEPFFDERKGCEHLAPVPNFMMIMFNSLVGTVSRAHPTALATHGAVPSNSFKSNTKAALLGKFIIVVLNVSSMMNGPVVGREWSMVGKRSNSLKIHHQKHKQ